MNPETKVFISHASEDKDALARPLAEKLKALCHVWYDEYSLPYGASIFGSISAGLSDCDFGVVILSHSFFQKKWTKDEIAGLFAREEPEQHRIIPIWMGVDKDDVVRFSPILADRRAISANQDINAILECIARVINDASKESGFVHTPVQDNPREVIRNLGKAHRDNLERNAMNTAPKASQSVYRAQTELVQTLVEEIERIVLENPNLQLMCKTSELRCLPYDILYLNVTMPNGNVARVETTRPSGYIAGVRLDLKVFRPKLDSQGNYEKPDHLEDHHFVPELNGAGKVFWKEGDSTPLDHSALVDLFLQTLCNHLKRVLQLS
jgi:hypothetical protein